jgi:CheY-like chemotaxis protein
MVTDSKGSVQKIKMTDATILYVDDDPDDRTFLREAFEEQHFPSAMYLPVMTGIELLKILKADARLQHIKVIVFSTTNKVEHQKECTRLGASEFLQKPISYSELRKLASYFMYQ